MWNYAGVYPWDMVSVPPVFFNSCVEEHMAPIPGHKFEIIVPVWTASIIPFQL